MSDPRQARIRRAIDYVQKNYSDALSIAKVSEVACMSEASFSRNFQETTGNRFTEFVNRIRVGHACSMLLETDAQIAAICYEVGFQNLANFNRHFLRYMGKTPSQYRKSARDSLVQ